MKGNSWFTNLKILPKRNYSNTINERIRLSHKLCRTMNQIKYWNYWCDVLHILKLLFCPHEIIFYYKIIYLDQANGFTSMWGLCFQWVLEWTVRDIVYIFNWTQTTEQRKLIMVKNNILTKTSRFNFCVNCNLYKVPFCQQLPHTAFLLTMTFQCCCFFNLTFVTFMFTRHFLFTGS